MGGFYRKDPQQADSQHYFQINHDEIKLAQARTSDFMADNHWGIDEERLLRLYQKLEDPLLKKLNSTFRLGHSVNFFT